MPQEFLFVNHDATTVGVRVDCGAVNSHVQFQHHKRNRDESKRPSKFLSNGKPRSLRPIKPAVVPGPDSEIGVGKFQERIEFELFNKARDRRTSTDSTVSGTSTDYASSPPSSFTFLDNGKIDPFSALAVPTTPFINSILELNDERAVLATRPIEKGHKNLSDSGPHKAWQDGINCLHDPELACLYLSSIGTSMAQLTGNEEMAKLSLAYKGRGYQVLRQRLKTESELRTRKTYDMITWMFWITMMNGDRVEAGLHLKMVANLLELHKNVEDFEPWWRLRLMAADVVFAIWGLSKPLLDRKRWCAENSYSDWRDDWSLPARLSTKLAADGLDDVLCRKELKNVFIGLRELNLVGEMLVECGPPTSSVFRWMDARLLGCESELVTIYVEMASRGHDSCETPSVQVDESRAFAYACIAALSWTGMVFGSGRHPQGLMMMSRLQTAILQGDQEPSFGTRFPRLRLWALFVGASLEKSIDFEAKDGDCQNRWHRTNFYSQAKKMGLRSWAEIRGVLEGFLYSERMIPQALKI